LLSIATPPPHASPLSLHDALPIYDADGAQDANEQGLPATIFLDANDNGRLDAGETSAATDALGHYAFSGLAAGAYTVRQAVEPRSEEHTSELQSLTKLACPLLPQK